MKKWMKMTATMMVAAMALTACGGNDAADDSADAGETYTVGIIQQLEHPALDAATKGFEDKLTELLGDKVKFDYQNAQGEQTNCTTIATKFVSNDVDLIMANATTALQAAAAATGDIPIVGTSVTDYKTAGVVDSNEKPGRNVTGVSDLAPVDQQIQLLMKLIQRRLASYTALQNPTLHIRRSWQRLSWIRKALLGLNLQQQIPTRYSLL